MFDFLKPKSTSVLGADSFTVPVPEAKPPMDVLPTQVVQDLLATYVTPALKELGFKKIGRTYYRANHDWQEIINIQSNRWNSRSEGMFTANLGVFHEPTSRAVWGRFAPKVPHEYDCQLRERIGFVMGSSDTWWSFDATTDLSALGEEVRAAITGPGLDYFARYKTLDDILSATKRANNAQAPVPSRICAALAFYAGRSDEAIGYLEAGAEFKNPISGEQRREAYDTAQRLGLPFDPPTGEVHLALRLVANEHPEVRAAQKLVDKVRSRILDLTTTHGSMYLYDFESEPPRYTFNIYGPNEEMMREWLGKTLKYASTKFDVAEINQET